MRAIKTVCQGKGISSIRLDPKVLEIARAAAADRKISLSEIIEEALQGYLLEH
jgi:predicted HicB family RNase H-like nuclease